MKFFLAKHLHFYDSPAPTLSVLFYHNLVYARRLVLE